MTKEQIQQRYKEEIKALRKVRDETENSYKAKREYNKGITVANYQLKILEEKWLYPGEQY